MQCPCGAATNYYEHVVKQLVTAKEWDNTINTVPVIVSRDECFACGRIVNLKVIPVGDVID